MNFSPEAVAGMSEEHKAAFLAQLEHMQIRDRCAAQPSSEQLQLQQWRCRRQSMCLKLPWESPIESKLCEIFRKQVWKAKAAPSHASISSSPTTSLPCHLCHSSAIHAACACTTTLCSGVSMTAWMTSAASTSQTARRRCVVGNNWHRL